jgi:hypothetical protein
MHESFEFQWRFNNSFRNCSSSLYCRDVMY